jgi:hypothetical protein
MWRSTATDCLFAIVAKSLSFDGVGCIPSGHLSPLPVLPFGCLLTRGTSSERSNGFGFQAGLRTRQTLLCTPITAILLVNCHCVVVPQLGRSTDASPAVVTGRAGVAQHPPEQSRRLTHTAASPSLLAKLCKAACTFLWGHAASALGCGNTGHGIYTALIKPASSRASCFETCPSTLSFTYLYALTLSRLAVR